METNQSRASPEPAQAVLSTKITALAAEGGAPTRIPLHPFGPFRGNHKDFLFDEASLAAIRRQKEDRGVDLVVDWHHQTLAQEEGKRDDAPAAAWVGDVVVEGDYVYGVIADWTPKASLAVANKEYRYISAVFNYDAKTGRVLSYHSFGLLNRPGTHHQRPVALAALSDEVHGATDQRAELSVSFGDIYRLLSDALRETFGDEAWLEEVFDDHVVFNQNGALWSVRYRLEDDRIDLLGAGVRVKKDYVPVPEENPMDERLRALLAALGLTEDATQEQVTAALSALQGQAALGAQTAQIVGLSEATDTPENRGQLMALASAADTTAELASLTAQLEEVQGDRAERLVTQALSSGRITAPQREYWLGQAKRDFAGAQAYLTAAPQIVPVDQNLADAVKPDAQTAALEQGQENINALLGLSTETYLKHNQ